MSKALGTATDEDLMVAAANDDLEAFEELVKRHQNRVYRMAYQILRTDEDAWDASQEIFIKVFNARATYVENAKFTTWLYRIANNAIIDKVRQFKRKRRESSMEDMLQEPPAEEKTTHQLVELEEIKEAMSRALNALSERQRSMVILKYYEGFSVNEIAEMFDCAAGTVKATLFQAVRHLKTRLGRQGIFSSEVNP